MPRSLSKFKNNDIVMYIHCGRRYIGIVDEVRNDFYDIVGFKLFSDRIIAEVDKVSLCRVFKTTKRDKKVFLFYMLRFLKNQLSSLYKIINSTDKGVSQKQIAGLRIDWIKVCLRYLVPIKEQVI